MLRTELARPGDIPAIMGLIGQAKEFLRAQGVDQWQNGYPGEDAIGGDVARGTGYLLTLDGRAVGYLCIDFGGEPSYAGLRGSWAGGGPYAVLHRLALDGGVRGRGLTAEVFRCSEALCRARGVYELRADTDADNHVMRHILEKNGFLYRGTVWFDNSEKIAFEKILSRA